MKKPRFKHELRSQNQQSEIIDYAADKNVYTVYNMRFDLSSFEATNFEHRFRFRSFDIRHQTPILSVNFNQFINLPSTSFATMQPSIIF